MDPQTAQSRIDKLRQQLRAHTRAYYTGEATISDEAYDQLIKELASLEVTFPEWQALSSLTTKVIGTPLPAFPSHTHQLPMLSLGNVYSVEELQAWADSVTKLLDTDQVEYSCELKFDGAPKRRPGPTQKSPEQVPRLLMFSLSPEARKRANAATAHQEQGT